MRKCVILVGALVTGSCTQSAGEVGVPADDLRRDPALRVDSAEYVLRPAQGGVFMTSIGISFVNPLPDTVYQPNCRRQLAITIERLDEDGSWRPYWAADMLRCLSAAPIVLAPGELYRDTLPVFGSLDRLNISPRFEPPPDPASTYRLVWRELVMRYNESGRPFGDPVAPFYSNSFRLRVDR